MGDCKDKDANINPGVTETICDDEDEDCDGIYLCERPYGLDIARSIDLCQCPGLPDSWVGGRFASNSNGSVRLLQARIFEEGIQGSCGGSAQFGLVSGNNLYATGYSTIFGLSPQQRQACVKVVQARAAELGLPPNVTVSNCPQ